MLDNYVPGNPAGNEAMPKVLVTGATGFLGRNLVRMLLEKGYRVRALARGISNIELLKELNIEIYYGDIRNRDSIESAFQNLDFVVHAAADTVGDKKGGDINTIQGTQNIVDLCKQYSVKKLVYISSCSVYGVADYKKGAVVNEESPLERFPARRGHYSHAKMKAEQIVTEAMERGGLAAVCLRPGTYFGSGGDVYTPMMGLSFGSKIFVIIGDGKFVLPLVYIENVADAIITVLEHEDGIGNIYNIVDDGAVNKRQYVQIFLKKLFPRAYFFYIPYSIFYSMVLIQEIVSKILKIDPFLTTYRVTSSQKNINYDSSEIRKELDWDPPYSLQEALQKVLKYERNQNR